MVCNDCERNIPLSLIIIQDDREANCNRAIEFRVRVLHRKHRSRGSGVETIVGSVQPPIAYRYPMASRFYSGTKFVAE